MRENVKIQTNIRTKLFSVGAMFGASYLRSCDIANQIRCFVLVFACLPRVPDRLSAFLDYSISHSSCSRTFLNLVRHSYPWVQHLKLSRPSCLSQYQHHFAVPRSRQGQSSWPECPFLPLFPPVAASAVILLLSRRIPSHLLHAHIRSLVRHIITT